MCICAIWQRLLALSYSFPHVGEDYVSCPDKAAEGAQAVQTYPGRNATDVWPLYHDLLPHSCSPVVLRDAARPTILLGSVTSFQMIFSAGWHLCYVKLRNCSIYRFHLESGVLCASQTRTLLYSAVKGSILCPNFSLNPKVSQK